MPIKTRTKKPVYVPVLKLPVLPYEQFVALRDNIAVNGVLVPILVDSDGPRREIIDGNYRKWQLVRLSSSAEPWATMARPATFPCGFTARTQEISKGDNNPYRSSLAHWLSTF